MLRYGVIGDPVAHSRSPAIHLAFAAQFGLTLSYERIHAVPARFIAEVTHFFARGGRGLNVTVPHKLTAAQQCARLSKRAKQAGAVNTLTCDANQWMGDNTDGVGLARDVQRLATAAGRSLRGTRILLVGAGGAARGAIIGLAELGCAQIAIGARDQQKARELACVFDHLGVVSAASLAGDAEPAGFEVIINASSAGLTGQAPAIAPMCWANAWLAYDLSYSQGAEDQTPFLRLAQDHGVALRSDGLGMLVEQAAESFWLWHGQRPAVAPVLTQLRRMLL